MKDYQNDEQTQGLETNRRGEGLSSTQKYTRLPHCSTNITIEFHFRMAHANPFGENISSRKEIALVMRRKNNSKSKTKSYHPFTLQYLHLGTMTYRVTDVKTSRSSRFSAPANSSGGILAYCI
tara:strand:- start:259 stop:627 length:369 start_codon:yes stop_codon:yes gene_type:complete